MNDPQIPLETEKLPVSPRISIPGRLILGLIFAIGVAFSIYAGIWIGMVTGLTTYEQVEPAPKGIGLAPDLSELVNIVLGIGFGGIIGGLVGLILGLIVMWAITRHLLRPLFAKKMDSKRATQRIAPTPG
ncbi:hypothetical protein KIH39_17925 [Telmatocola sphagniphila]|uniref:Uncharacterized protein n=1 Tax=Telmatocola sphagniphila TaxID=1123043 RepID=A0A8E6B2W8_9BACT|nr:hypothetical protein [Telmatocola sphagniphila]QVL30721.1 hypothetical protein KIH39_17925 [Telmatocola sphagniphila]